MAWFHYALLSLACFALVASWNVPRCRLWVFALAASYLVSVLYYHFAPSPSSPSDWPHGAFVAFACDCTLFLLIREYHKSLWEMRGLGSIIMISVSLNAIQMIGLVCGWPPMLSQEIYSSVLELVNAAYLLVIGGKGTLEWIAKANAKNARHNLHGYRGGGLATLVSIANEKSNKKTTVSQPLRHW